MARTPAMEEANAEEAVVLDREAPQFLEEGPSLPALLTEDFVKQFEKGVEIYKRWVSVCYRLTRESHWLCRNGKYSLQGPGAEALMNPLGISYERPSFRREDLSDDRGDFYCYWCEGYAESKTLGRRGWYIGYCDSRDPFFNARPGWNAKSGEGDIKKSAMTNWTVNFVTRVAGIRDPDPESLRAAGLDATKITVVDYSGQGSRTAERSGEAISEAQSKRLWAIARGKGWSEGQVKVLLEGFEIAHTAEIPRSKYDGIIKVVEQAPPAEVVAEAKHRETPKKETAA